MNESRGRFIMLSYDFPPFVRSGTYRPMRFARTMYETGREIIVVTASEWSETRGLDMSLLGDWMRGISVKRILSFSSILVALEKALGRFGLGGLVFRARKRFLFPDEQILWAIAAFTAVALSRPRPCDVVLTTSPPWSVHIAGLLLKTLFGVRWIADHRDPWTRNPHFRGKGPREAALHARAEALVHARCDAIIAASRTQARNVAGRFGVPPEKVLPLYTGYDEEDFRGTRRRQKHELFPAPTSGDPGAGDGAGSFVILYAGALYEDYFPDPFLEGLREFLRTWPQERERVRVFFFLSHSGDRMRKECERRGLLDAVVIGPAIPHSELTAFLRGADALLLFIPDIPGALGWVPGKTFEYLASGTPVLALVPPASEAASLVASSGRGIVVESGEPSAVARGLVALTGAKVTGAPPKGGTDVLSWRVLSRVFLELVDSVSPGEAGRKRPQRLRVALAASGLGIVARGVESFTLDLGRALATGFDVSVYGGGRSGAGHRVIPCIGRNNGVARACMERLPGSARRVIRRLRLDPLGLEKLTFSLGLTLALLVRRQDVLVQSDGWWGGLFSRVARKLTGVRVITVGHGGLGGALEEIAQSTDCYINVNFTIVDELARRWPGKRIVSLPLFVDTSRYAPGASQLALSLPRPVFLTVGALEEEKRIDLAVKALGKLGEGSLLIVGSGRMEHDLRQLCMRILGEGRFHITRASRDEMVHYYTYADVFTLPSPREAFSLSVLEALACDLPVVTVKEGMRNALGNGCIVACDPGDPVAYAAALRKATGMAGTGMARQKALRYSTGIAASAWSELVREVCGK